MEQKQTTREEYSRRINIVVEYINNHLDREISLDALAALSNFSPYHFHRITHAVLGEPIGAFITRMRVETAARLLRYCDMPIREVAYKVGYDVPSSLSKAFKSFYNISPNDYRNNKTYSIMKPIQVNLDLKLEQRIEELKPKQVIYLHYQGDYQKVDYCGAWKKLWDYIRRQNVFAEKISEICNTVDKSEILSKICDETGIETICIYYDDPKVTETDKQRTDVCLSVSTKIEPKGEIGVKTIEGGKYAIFRYVGSYDKLGMVYDTIYGKYIFEMKHQLASRPGFEVYLNDPQSTKPEDLVTEIYVPIE